MTTRHSRLTITLAGACLLAISSGAAALKPPDISEAEMALLPRYCADAQGFKYGDAYSNPSPRAAGWVAMMGNSFWHVHHHCWALINVRRAQQARVPEAKKKALLEEALGDFVYVVKNTPEDFVLLPEVLTWVGRTQVKLNHPQAAEAFARARELKPDYWPAYYHWAEALAADGRKADALAMARQGLGHAPDAKPLLQLYRDLGGRPADIPPRKPKPVAAPAPESGTDTPAADADAAGQTRTP